MFLASSLFIFIEHNWEQIPALVKAVSAISLSFLAHLYAYNKLEKTSNYFFLSNFVYGASIMIVSQAYHLGSNFANGIFLWAIGVYAILVFVENKWIYLQAFALGFFYYILEVSSSYPYFFWVFLILSILALKKENVRFVSFFIFIVFMEFGIYSVVEIFYNNSLNKLFVSGDLFSFVIMPIFCYVMILVYNFFGKKTFLKKYQNTILFLCFLGIYIFLSLILIEESFTRITRMLNSDYSGKYLIFLPIVIFSIIILIFSTLLKEKKYIYAQIIYFSIICSLSFFGIKYNNFIFVIINIFVLVFYIYLIYTGIKEHNSYKYFFGIFGVLLFIMIKYINLINDYRWTSLMFLICACIFLYAAKYFRKITKDIS